MGWTSFQMNQPVKEWFKKEWSDNNVTILDIAIVKRNTLYAAIKNNETKEVFCAVYLLRWSREREYNFSYKSMTEYVGPCESECPERLLKLLSPLNDQNDLSSGYAREWRKRCENNITNSKKLSGKFAIKTKEPVSFTSGRSYQYFKRINRKMYAGLMEGKEFINICRVRLSLKYIEYEFVETY